MKPIIPVILALLIALTACGQPQAPEPPAADAAPAPPAESGPDPVSVCTVAEGITFSLLQSVYPPGVERLTMVMDNRSDFELCHGEYVAFQQYAGGQWQTLAYAVGDVLFHDVAWVLQPHRAGQFTIDAGLLARPLEEGLYRVSGDAQMWLNSEDPALHEPVPGWQVEFRVAAEAPPEPDYALFIHGQPVSGMEPIQIVFLNSTGEQAHVLDIPHLERMTEGGAWEDVPYREQVGFCGTPSTMPPGGRIWSEDPAALWGTLEPGLYRLRYAVGPTEKTEGEAAGQFTVGAPEVCGLPLAEGA